jgi:hypothetical protein
MPSIRNKPCPCGSQKKFKKCCLIKERQIREEQRNGAEYAILDNQLVKIKDGSSPDSQETRKE